MMPNWSDPRYLAEGTPRQRQAYTALQALRVLTVLGQFGPVLAGTIPLDVDVAGSDLDLICRVLPVEQAQFAARLEAHFGQQQGFGLRFPVIDGRPTVIGSFRAAGFDWEIFGQELPSMAQHACRHLVAEYRVLQAGGPAWRRAVRHLKQQGLKTEPAFATLLALPGDPYAAMLTLEELSDEQLRALVAARPLPAG